jgi:hypothetical protein
LPEANQANTANQRVAANAPSIEPQRTNTNTMQARGHVNTREKPKDGSGRRKRAETSIKAHRSYK